MSIRKPPPENTQPQVPAVEIVVRYDPQTGVTVRHPADPLLVCQLLGEAIKAVAGNAARAVNAQQVRTAGASALRLHPPT